MNILESEKTLFDDPVNAWEPYRPTPLSALGCCAGGTLAPSRGVRGDLGSSRARRERWVRAVPPPDPGRRVARTRRPAGLGFRRHRCRHGGVGPAPAFDGAGADALALPSDLHAVSLGRGHDAGLARATMPPARPRSTLPS